MKNLMYRGEDAKAIPRCEEAPAILEKLDARFGCAIVQGELGTWYMHLGETDKALELLERTAEIFRASGVVSHDQVSLADIGSVYLYRRKFLTSLKPVPNR